MKKIENKTRKNPNVFMALLPVFVMMALMLYGFLNKVPVTGENGTINYESIYSDAHMPLIVAIIVACIVGKIYGRKLKELLEGMLSRIATSLHALLILICVGLLISAFMISGTIPALVYYGLDLLNPTLFLPAGCVICALVGLACGSSWTATATVGVALLAIGHGLGIPAPITAGMVISGAYVGDKFSPLSDTTNLAAAVSETGLFDHVRAMVSTTGPTFVIAVAIYAVMGFFVTDNNYDPSVAEGMKKALEENFNLNPLVLLPIVVVLFVCIKKIPGLVGIIISIGVGIAFALAFQNVSGLSEIFKVLHYGPTIETGNAYLDNILAKGGMDNQMWTVNLIILALAYGGVLEACGCVEALFGKLKERINSVGGLVGATMCTSLFCDAAMGDQFLGIGIPGPLYASKYDELGLSRTMLSRTLEDCGTLWSPMFPWTGCGAYQMAILGVHPFAYFPFAFVNLLNPLLALGLSIFKRNVFWADGSYTDFFGRTKMKAVADAPEQAHKKALANLGKLREDGKVPEIQQY